jgi:tetratricopeptide (TPR) repeat protein
MLVPSLIAILIILGTILFYLYFLSPRLNPFNRADFYMKQNQLEQATLEYTKILDRDPDNPLAHYRLASIYFNQGLTEKGVHHLEEVIRINKYSAGVNKTDVERKLAEAYSERDQTLEAFRLFFDILKSQPSDASALYHVSFILLGQEYFELAQRYFDRLATLEERNFEIVFGAGIACYQNQKTNESVDYFKEALSIDPHSDIANLAMAFAQQKKHDYKAALNYARMIIDTSSDENALFIAKRLYGILAVQAKRPSEGVKVLEEVLDYARKKDMTDEVALVLYDLGFAAIHAEMTELAYEYWNQLYQYNREYKNIQHLALLLRKEMDSNAGAKDVERSVIEYSEEWIKDAFPSNFIWSICGLQSTEAIDVEGVLVAARAESQREGIPDRPKYASSAAADRIDAFNRLDAENFRIIAGRVVAKLGFRVDEILTTYRESDGVDFLASSPSGKEKTLVWVRRWKDILVGEIPLRNLAQAVNDIKAKQGIFITTTDLTPASESSLRGLAKIRVIFPAELGDLLSDLW